ncbi:MAG: hypothetical protein UZ16_OP3001000105, partial [Candidatus Hinthialibacteria bacterium OLB16]
MNLQMFQAIIGSHLHLENPRPPSPRIPHQHPPPSVTLASVSTKSGQVQLARQEAGISYEEDPATAKALADK